MNYDTWKATDPAWERGDRLQGCIERVCEAVEQEWRRMGLGPGETPVLNPDDIDPGDLYDEEVAGYGHARNRAEVELETWFEKLEDPGPYVMTVGKWLQMNRFRRLKWVTNRQRAGTK